VVGTKRPEQATAPPDPPPPALGPPAPGPEQPKAPVGPSPYIPLQSEPIPTANEIDRDWPTLPPRKLILRPDAPNLTKGEWYAPGAGGAPVAVLPLPNEPFPLPPGRDGPHRGLLGRELARQALLVAAREEFGATTRDAALREPPGNLSEYALAGTFELGWT